MFRAWDLEAQRLVALKVFNPARVSAPTWKAYAEVVNAALAVRHPDVILPLSGVPQELPSSPALVLGSLGGEGRAAGLDAGEAVLGAGVGTAGEEAGEGGVAFERG